MSGGEKTEEKTLKIRMLGECSISLNGELLDCFGSAHSKTMKLFILLAYYGAQGVGRQEVLDALYGDSDHTNESGNLRAVSFRVRRQMIQAGLLAEDVSISERGIFRWEPMQISVEIDAKEFEAAAHRALEEGKKAETGELSDREERAKAAEHLRKSLSYVQRRISAGYVFGSVGGGTAGRLSEAIFRMSSPIYRDSQAAGIL